MIATRTLGFLGAAWAAAYLPIHVYWALGGRSSPLGITGDEPGFRAANWAACLVIAGAGLTALSLTRPEGERLPAGLRRGAAWIGGGFALLHWLVYTTASTVRLAGVVGYPDDADVSAHQLRNFDWVNVTYFELWFGVMGVLLIACARRHRALDLVRRRPRVPSRARVANAVLLAGVATAIGGVFLFQPWVFAGCAPVLIAAGLLLNGVTTRARSLR